ncbi:MAG: beta-phosphoglucomutase family hydrolase [Elusimicrobia bacterium]|nr:beta-phosphoglucomutase family hydrolase [Elusimicrobiota bacterium]
MTGAVIFDLDGIVVDTVPIHFKAWKRMFGEYGKEFTFKDYKEKVDGIPRIDGARAILTGLSDREIEEASLRKQGYFREYLDSMDIPVYESTVSLIRELNGKGIPRVVISSSKNCVHILKKTGVFGMLDAVIDGTMITRGKPDPQIFLMAAERLSVSPGTCVVFEDAVLGVRAAKRAAMYCVGVDRYDSPSRLAEADTVVKDISELSFDSIVNLV